MKALIFDSGPLINLSLNGLLPILESLKKEFSGKFIITPQVKREVYDRPVNIKQFELGALRIDSLINNKILEFPEALQIKQRTLDEETRRLMNVANNSFKTEGHYISIVSDAEISCIALSKQLMEKGIDTMIVVDERTARMLGEKPENLERLMSQKFHKTVSMINNLAKDFQGLKFIRSSEVVYVAYKKGLIKIEDDRALEALLYATKFKGSAISFDEIETLRKG